MKYLSFVMILSAAAIQAQVPPPRPPSVQASGDAVVSVKPDQVKIDIGVVTQAATAQAAAAQNAAQVQAVITKLRPLVGAKGDIKTINYSVSPNYQFSKEGKRTINGFTANNIVQVTSEDVDGIGKVIDAAGDAAANEIQRLQFLLKDEKAPRAQALRQAAIAARSNAEAMASALGLKLGHVLMLDQGAPEIVHPVRTMAMSANARMETPIESGAVEVHATVTLTVALEQ